jgi:radical SAM superfamily enzyme YgiQ (UPF0313 family)
VVEEFKSIPEKAVLIVDDNLIGGSKSHVKRTKDLFRALIEANTGKLWIAQTTLNMADDDELLQLAAKAGCAGVFIGFETATAEGLKEVNKKLNFGQDEDFKDCVRRIQKHGILVIGSFIMGLDVDREGIGTQIADTATAYGLDLINVLFLTPLPGTRLWDDWKSERRIAADAFPEEWDYYTLTFPVAEYKHLSWDDLFRENVACSRSFYSYPRMIGRMLHSLVRRRHPLYTIVSNLSIRATSLHPSKHMDSIKKEYCDRHRQ